jgi:ABC-2 type transport system ATP-binding protein
MGKTIIISSHILHELAELCNMVGVVEQGELLFSGSVTEIMKRASMGQVVHITVDERAEQAAALLAKVKGITKIDLTQHNGTPRIDVTIDPASGLMMSELPSRLIAQGFRLTSMMPEQVNLETAFMRLTKGLVA